MAQIFAQRIPTDRFKVEQRGRFTIVGNGDFGGKAKDLIEKSDPIERAGFLIPQSVILTTEFFAALYENARRRVHGKMEREKLLSALMNAKLGSEERKVLRALADPKVWLAVRSSQLDEREGSGKYFSGFCRGMNEHGVGESLTTTIKKVVASSGNEDMAVLIQPVIGDGGQYSIIPRASGWAYSTRLRNSGEGKMCVVFGMGTKAVMIGGDTYFFGHESLRQTEHDPSPSIFHLLRETGIEWDLDDGGGRYVKDKETLLRELPLMLKALERAIGKPQYIEYALGNEGIYCLQIADTVPLNDEKMDLSNAGRVLVKSNTVNGMMERDLQGIVWTNTKKPWGDVTLLDAIANGYVLVVPSGIFSRAHLSRQISREVVPNVGGIVVYAQHSGGTVVAGNHVRQAFGTDVPFMVTSDGNFTRLFEGDILAKDEDWNRASGKFLFQVNEAVGFGYLRVL